jgi:MFS family permease
MTKDFSLEAWRVIFLNALFQGGRLTVGAISSLYFLQQGFSLGEFAQLKSIQAVIFLAFDIPIGLFLTWIGSYRSMLISTIFGFLGAVGYLISTNLGSFMISEAFIALSLSIWPPSMGAYCMAVLKPNEGKKGVVERYFHTGDAIANISIVLAGVCGAWLYQSSIYLPYLAFAMIYLLAASLLLKKPPPEVHEIISNRKNRLSFNFGALRKIWPFILMMCATQFAFQPILHYWQPFFKDQFQATTFDISIVFVAYSLTMSGTSSIYAFLNKFSFFHHPLVPISLGAFASLYFFGLSSSPSYVSALILFSFLFAFVNIVQMAASILIQKRVSDEERINCSKQTSFIARIAMLISLTLFGFLSRLSLPIDRIFFIYGAISLVAFTFLGITAFAYSLRKETLAQKT